MNNARGIGCGPTAACILASLASNALAQTVNPAVLVATRTQTGGDNNEVVTTSSALSPQEVVVAWQRVHPGTGLAAVFCSVSLNNGVSFSPPQPVFPPCPYSIGGCCTEDVFDPFAASSRITGDNWIGGIDGASTPAQAFGRILVVRRAAGSTLLSYQAQAIPCSSADKTFMAVGP